MSVLYFADLAPHHGGKPAGIDSSMKKLRHCHVM